MKKILVTLLVVVLSGCAGHAKKSEIDIYNEALTAVSVSSGQTEPEIVTVDIPSHGALADLVVIGVGGGANATYLREVFTSMKKSSDKSVLIMGSSPMLDYAVVSNAVKNMDLSGMQVLYSNTKNHTKMEQDVKSTGATFHFISKK